MSLVLSALVATPCALLMMIGLIPSSWADAHTRGLRRAAVTILAAAFATFAAASGILVASGPADLALVSWEWPIPMNLGIYFDGISAIMALLICFIGWVIARYSVRYLDGDPTQGRFVRWMAFTLGAVLMMVLARNLAMFAAAWMLTSFGLHQLLTHYPRRPWAIWAARKKFLISRLGDVMLIAAIVLTYHTFGSLDYRDLFAASVSEWIVSLIGILFVLGAMTKSAQFPFHSWLPDTMETPTPVSALMHAGVINAGGFLVIRLSPLVSQSHSALDFLALIGAVTTLLGGVVMMTQSSIKRSLAYSTIAQMGFMMLQCGLGAFSAAFLHIIAHSLYKAHAFLSCGSTLESAALLRTAPRKAWSDAAAALALPAAAVVAWAALTTNAWLWRTDFGSKPGAWILGPIVMLALTHLIWNAMASNSWRITATGIGAAFLASWAYLGAWLAIDMLTAPVRPVTSNTLSPIGLAAIAVAAVGFVGVFFLQALADRLSHMPAIRSLYVHAANGFYLDIPVRRLTARIWGGIAPTP
ncbi:MAG: proton-conducting transporter membrane subunit [Gemmataceae bacterium]